MGINQNVPFVQMKISLGKCNSEQISFELHVTFAWIMQRIEMSLAFPHFGKDTRSDWREKIVSASFSFLAILCAPSHL